MKYLSILIIVLIPLAIIFSSTLYLQENYNFYKLLYREQNIYNNFKNPKILDSETQNLLGFFRGKNMLDQNFYSNQARIHLADVKNLLNIVKTLALTVDFILVLGIVYLAIKKRTDMLKKAVFRGSVATMVITVLIAFILIFDFVNLFIAFHRVLFRNNYWLFNPSDNLIKMFPESFFVLFANYLAVYIIVTATFILFLTKVLEKINDKPRI